MLEKKRKLLMIRLAINQSPLWMGHMTGMRYLLEAQSKYINQLDFNKHTELP
jgi:hypothetical protein